MGPIDMPRMEKNPASKKVSLIENRLKVNIIKKTVTALTKRPKTMPKIFIQSPGNKKKGYYQWQKEAQNPYESKII
jgi:hypothetical protein